MSTLQVEDRLLIRDTVDKFIEDHYAFAEREQRHEKQGKFGDHWTDFVDLGWTALPFSEEAGGLGGGVIDVQVLMHAFGRGLIAEPYTEVVLLAGKTLEFCAPAERIEELLMPLITGESLLVLAHGEQRADTGFDGVKCQSETRSDGYVISGSKRVVCQAGAADRYLVTAWLDGKPALFCVDKSAENLVVEEYQTIDSRYAADIHLKGVAVASNALIASGDIVKSAVKEAILYAFAAQVAEVEGIAQNLRKMTAEYLNTREQFGTKIVNFQALQHMFADMVIAEEEIKSMAWLLASTSELEDSDERERLIRISKARVGKVSRQLAETAVQLHGGIGVTDELIVSHYLRRIVAVDAMYGDSQQQLIWLAQQY